MLANLRIHWKLALLSATFLAPIALLAWLFIDQSHKDTKFAAKELDGSRYLASVREVLTPLAMGEAERAAAGLEGVQRSNDAVGLTMNLADAPAKALAAVRRAGAEKADPATPTGREAMAAVRKLIAMVGDGSNLILDPDLDSFYAMDLVVVKLPQATEQAVVLLDAVTRVVGHDKPSLAAVAELQLRLGEYTGTLSGIDESLEAAIRGNPDGSLKAALTAPFDRFRDTSRAYVKAVEALSMAAAAATGALQPQAAGDLPNLRRAVLEQTQGVWQLAETELDRLLIARIQGFNQKLYWSLGASGVVLLIAGLLAFLIGRSIGDPVAALVASMNGMAAGDLTVAVPCLERRDEAGILARAAVEMQRHLRALATEVRTNAGAVHGAAQRITGAVEGQAASSAEMSSSVAEITSTMEELSASSTQISEHSHAVVAIANATWESSKKGAEAMEGLSARIADIQVEDQHNLKEILDLGRTSKEISKVMSIIGTIADQTKLIAFNAALEAASAGEAGRRFGVVAAEIRRLADSVTESTGEIESRINQIQDSISRLVITSERRSAGIEAGITATSTTARRLGELVDAAQQTSSAAQQISLSTQQQKTASNQVVVALREIVVASSQTAQSINRISEISRDMTRLSAELGTLVGRFRLES